jgi:hypothetical protein
MQTILILYIRFNFRKDLTRDFLQKNFDAGTGVQEGAWPHRYCLVGGTNAPAGGCLLL